MDKWKLIKHIVIVGLSVAFLYILINSCISFYRGFRNLDIAQNFLQLGYTHDLGLNGQSLTLKEYYLAGLNQMQFGFQWICFDVILAFVIGYLFRR